MIASWDHPQAFVDHFIVSISPPPLSHPMETMVFSPPWNVTLKRNVKVYISIVAVNCNGESDPLLFNITSKLSTNMYK
jgi:hypothetical protein